MQGWTLPTTVTVGGKPYAVHVIFSRPSYLDFYFYY